MPTSKGLSGFRYEMLPVEIDEVYVVAGHKGQSDLVKKNPGQDEGDA